MEYYNGIWCISRNELVDGGYVTAANYQNWTNRRKINVVRPGKGRGNYALISVESLPGECRDKLPDERQTRLEEWVKSQYSTDAAATAYFFSPAKCGVELPQDKAREYVTNASVLNACIRLHDSAKAVQRLMGGSYDWTMMAAAIEALRRATGHTLPGSVLRFRKKVNEYRRHGYASLVSGKFGNQNTRKVDERVERLIVSIAAMPNKPWNTDVQALYNSFVTGELEVYDAETGALYDPDDFTDRDGGPLALSASTIANYLNRPRNRVLIDRAQKSYTAFMHENAPHMHRHAGEFSLSKVSFDDRDLPRKLRDTRQRPKAYYAYDVTSGCCIGFAYNRTKSADLVVDMFRNMFRLLDRHGWGCPAEVEVENHLMSQWRDSFLRAGVMFPFVRFCAPMNSQEKHAEQFNGAKKRTVEHRNHYGIGRFYARSRQYRTESVKVFDELNDTYAEKEYYSWDELIADDMRDIEEYNNAPHHNQKRYPGMSRWDVLVANINPGLQPLDKATIARYVGEKVSTTVRRNSYCRVCGEDWWLSKTAAIDLLAPNNYKVDAYYLTDDEGKITDMFIYQGDMYIDRLDNVGTFCTARAEQTDGDLRTFVEQRKKMAEFNSYVDGHAVSRLGILRPEAREAAEPEAAEAVAEVPSEELPEGGWDARTDYAAAGKGAV